MPNVGTHDRAPALGDQRPEAALPCQRPAIATRMPMKNMPSIDSGQNASSSAQPVWSRSLTPMPSAKVEAIAKSSRTRLEPEEEAGQPALAERLGRVEDGQQPEQAELEDAAEVIEESDLLDRAGRVGAEDQGVEAPGDGADGEQHAALVKKGRAGVAGADSRVRRGTSDRAGAGVCCTDMVVAPSWVLVGGAFDDEDPPASVTGQQGAASRVRSPGDVPARGTPNPGRRDVRRSILLRVTPAAPACPPSSSRRSRC